MHETEQRKIPKYVSPDSSMGLYLITRKPRYLWSFIFALITFLCLLFGGMHFLMDDGDMSAQETTQLMLKFVIAGSGTMSLSSLFYGDMRGFIGLVLACFAAIFIFQLA
ncbi:MULTISPECIES: hypothetical protein [Salinimonas]|uniref:Uncharacterized protein n=2 Tax=Salinimonas TaxID=288793 RepID=A0A5B7YJ76_9ALTE|nr:MULTISPECIES: hypothetical protein [Salinimonas]MBD3587160.1 hypothetical protein [Salinimonas profundi]QCZ95370.1 hypothetical protein FBQ74_17680 [Salinimonas iocasae]